MAKDETKPETTGTAAQRRVRMDTANMKGAAASAGHPPPRHRAPVENMLMACAPGRRHPYRGRPVTPSDSSNHLFC